MAKSFGDTKGGADKVKVPYFKFKNGTNVFRMVDGILSRYVYWQEAMLGNSKRNLAFECLSFDRDQEKFTNAERDPFQEMFPEKKCSWAYAVNCIDPSDGEVKVLALKKKLYEQIQTAAEDLGDPTDKVTGWDIHVKKTGEKFDTEYTLQVLRCKPRELTDEEKTAVEESKSIDEYLPRPTPEDQESFLNKVFAEPEEDSTPDDVEGEFDEDGKAKNPF